MLDKIGRVVSFGCMIHCILTPIVLPLLPMMGFLVGYDSHFHLILSGVITLIAGLALIPGYFKHRVSKPLAIGIAGIITIIGCGFIEHIEPTNPYVLPTTIYGSALIILSHYLNHKLACKCEHHNH